MWLGTAGMVRSGGVRKAPVRYVSAGKVRCVLVGRDEVRLGWFGTVRFRELWQGTYGVAGLVTCVEASHDEVRDSRCIPRW